MDTKEVIERQKYSDVRVFHAIMDAKKDDNSFKEKENFFTLLSGGIKYSQAECRDIWFNGMAVGMERGLEMASLEGQKIDVTNNCKVPKHKEFLERFYKLASEYNCAIQYHPHHGMVVIDRG